MNKQQYKEVRRLYRIAAKMSEELVLDQLIYGTAFQFQDETGIYNIPPNEILYENGKFYIIRGDKVEQIRWTP